MIDPPAGGDGPGRLVIVAYRPKAGRESELDALVASHVDILRREGLATDRETVAMRAADGTVIEVFEWVSANAIESAHRNERVLALWARFAEASDYVPVGAVPEAAELFSEFSPL